MVVSILRHRMIARRTLAARSCKPRVSLAALSVLVAAGPLSAVDWQPIGPAPISGARYTGRVSAIAPSESNANLYYVAGADGGVWRTADGGLTWTPLTDHMPTNAMGALAVDPGNDQIVYAGTGEANFANHSRYGLGVYKSIDGGNTWTQYAESTFAGRCFSRIRINPQNTQILYASITRAGGFPEMAAARGHLQATGPLGIFKSIDGGQTWIQLTNGIPGNLSATDIAMDPTNPNVLYAAIGHIFGDLANGIYKSVDGGASWTKLAGGLPTTGVGRISIGLAPSLPSRLYAQFAGAATSTGGNASTLNIYRSDDAGLTWTPTNPPSHQATYGWYLSLVTVSPTDPDLAFAGGLDLLRTTNGGGSWGIVTGGQHVDFHACEFDAAGRVLSGNDGGFYVSANNGTNWTVRNEGLGLIQFYAGLSVDSLDESKMFGGTQDNGTIRRTGTAPDAWVQVIGGDGGYTGVNQQDPNYVWGEFQGTANLYRSTNGGLNFNSAGGGITGRNCFLPPYEIDPLNGNHMIYGTERLFETTNATAPTVTWTAITGDLTTGTGAINGLAFAPSNPQTIYVMTNDGNVVVSVGGGPFNISLAGVPTWPRTMRPFAVDPGADLTCHLAVGWFGVNQVLKTTTGGAGGAWSSVVGDLPDVPVHTVTLDTRRSPHVVYAGSDQGVWRTHDGGVSWERFGDGLPNTPVIDFRIRADRGWLRAATQGRGVWQVTLYPGDFDFDGDVDLSDFTQFQLCFGGSNNPPAPTCPPGVDADLDDDGDVDLADFLIFQQNFTGSL